MDELRPSKSQKKRDMHELQSLGEQLMNLKQDALQTLTLSDRLLFAIDEAKRIKSREALRRQKQYIGKLMKSEDIEQIRAFLEQLSNEQKSLNQSFKALEEMRSALLSGGVEAINAVIEAIPDIDRQKLRQLTKRAKKELEEQRPPQAQRALFKFLRNSQAES